MYRIIPYFLIAVGTLLLALDLRQAANAASEDQPVAVQTQQQTGSNGAADAGDAHAESDPGTIARQLIGDEKYDEAIVYLNEAINETPEDLDLVYIRGSVYANIEMHEEALVDFKHLIEHDPSNIYVQYGIGISHTALGQHDEAEIAFTRFIEIQPEFAQTYLDRGAARWNLGKKDAAREDINRFLELVGDENPEYRQQGLDLLNTWNLEG